MRDNKNQINTTYLFLFICGILLLLALGYTIFKSGEPLKTLIWNGETHGLFPDFYESLRDARSREPYNTQAIYPAIVYAFLYLVSRMIPGDYNDWHSVATSQLGVVMAIVIFMIATALIWLYISKTLELNNISSMLFLLVFLMSPAYIFMIERGNLVIFSLLFLMVYLYYYDSEQAVLREISLISLALAFSFKLYPVVFGLLLLKDKRFKEAIRTAIYGSVFFVVPFVFMGGLSGIGKMIENITSISNRTLVNNNGFGYGYKVNIENFSSAFFECMGWKGNIDLGVVLTVISLLVMLFIVLFSKQRWQRILGCSLMCVLIPGFSWMYNVLYLLLPLVYFMKENSQVTRRNVICTILFALIFSPLPYGYIADSLPGANKISISTLTVFISLLAIMGISFIDTCIVLMSNKKGKCVEQ